MKNFTNKLMIPALFLMLVGFSTCKNKDVDFDTFKIERERVLPEVESVTITGSYSYIGEVRGMAINIGEKESLTDALTYDMLLEGTDFSIKVEGLKPSTKYYYRYTVDLGGNETLLTETESFTTLDAVVEAPTVEIQKMDTLSNTAIRLFCKITSTGGAAITKCGICWNTYENDVDPTTSDFTSDFEGNPSNGEFDCKLEDLELSTRYHIRAYAENEKGRGYSTPTIHYSTQGAATEPIVYTIEVTDITNSSANCWGNMVSDGGSELIERGACWSTSSNPTIENAAHASDESIEMGSYTIAMTELTANTVYYVRCYAINAVGIGYGEERSFTTSEGLPTVQTSGITNISANSAIGGGNVTDEGASTVTERGICWSTNHNPTINDNIVPSGSGIGSFTAQITGLTQNETYYVRAYATNTQGTAYGSEVNFTATEDFPTVITSEIEQTSITTTTATGGGIVTDEGASTVIERGICWSTNHYPTINDSHAQAPEGGTGQFTVNMTGLTHGTLYYVCAYATNSYGTSYGNEVSFTTLSELPTVMTTTTVTNITHNSATSGGVVTDDGGAIVTSRGVCWSTSQNPTLDNCLDHTTDGSGTGDFTSNISSLQPGTTYFIKAYATNIHGTAYGDQVSFTTQITSPQITWGEISNLTQTSCYVSYTVTSDGGDPNVISGVCWSTSHNPTTSGSHVQGGTGMGTFSVQITGLTANTTYYVRAYATNGVGTAYSSEVSFTTTQNTSTPTVTTSQVTNITQTTATGGGNVTADGGAPVLARGVCWSTSHNPTINDSHTNNGSGVGSFTSNLTGLNAGTTYYVRAYATNSVGTAYGSEVSFTTEANAPTVTTDPVTNPTQTTATCGGNVTADGGATVTARGVCWSTSQNPTISNSHTNDGTGTGNFTSSITGLTANTTYYVRAYATNSANTSYGNQRQFTTPPNVVLPTVTTSQVTNITQTTATGGGNVTNAGNGAVSERGICWSTSHNPTINDSHVQSGSGMGSFSAQMTGLTANTTYYVRAYAKNSAGTAYGSEVSFATVTVTLPTVITNQVTNITQTTATGGGNVTNAGNGTVTARGVCWSTNHNPTINDSHTNNGSGTGNFTSNITGLTANTTYYVRAYATNSAGTAYGAEESFTTSQNVTVPTVTTNQVTNITQTTATGGGNVTNEGNSPVTERGICWSTNHNPTISGSHIQSGSGTGTFTSQMTGLTANTTYYVRAYAINDVGLAYGSEVSFTTSQNVIIPTVTTNQVTDITQTTATGGGNVTNTGYGNVTERGICWSTSHNPTTSNSHVQSGSGPGSFAAQMTGLTANTTYYVRAYAINEAGLAYGSEVSFTTMTLPTVTTSQVTIITQTEATGGGNVTNAGNGTVTARGVCWSTSHNPTINGNHVQSGSGTGTFTAQMTGLTANTTYYVRAYATNGAGTAYGSEVSFTTLPNGAINGRFSVSSSQQVYFSKGNLQYKATTNTWRFAEHQYDYVGTQIPDQYGNIGGNVSGSDNHNIGENYNGWIDLFGWGTSGYVHGAICYQPWSTAPNNYNYYAYGSQNYDLEDESGQADWGYNSISYGNGTTPENQWRTLTKNEWNHVFNVRQTSTINGTPNARYAKAKVANIYGVILFPDTYSHPSGVPQPTNINNPNIQWNQTNNIYNSTQWGQMENQGAVFLPAAGYRVGNPATVVNYAGAQGLYWSSTHQNDQKSYMIRIMNTEIIYNDSPEERHCGLSVRLVCSPQ